MIINNPNILNKAKYINMLYDDIDGDWVEYHAAWDKFFDELKSSPFNSITDVWDYLTKNDN